MGMTQYRLALFFTAYTCPLNFEALNGTGILPFFSALRNCEHKVMCFATVVALFIQAGKKKKSLVHGTPIHPNSWHYHIC